MELEGSRAQSNLWVLLKRQYANIRYFIPITNVIAERCDNRPNIRPFQPGLQMIAGDTNLNTALPSEPGMNN